MEVCRKLDNIKLENRPYTEVSKKLICFVRTLARYEHSIINHRQTLAIAFAIPINIL
jgi:hypothetical protein